MKGISIRIWRGLACVLLASVVACTTSGSGSRRSSESGVGAPTKVRASAWPYTALIDFTPSAAPAGKTIVSYTASGVTSGYIAGTASAPPIMVQGGSPGWGGSAQWFSVVANYSDGTSSASLGTSNAVTPSAGFGNSTSPNVYVNGVFYWMGDYNYSGTSAYCDKTGDPQGDSAGPGPCDVMFVNGNGQHGGWQPYVPNGKFDLSAYNYMYVDLKPTQAGASWNMYYEKVGDVGVGVQITLPADANGTYGPAPQPGVWATYKIPLKNLNVGPQTANPIVFKFCIQDYLPGPNTTYINNVHFSAN
jgi:hypothetical protein